MNDEKKLHENLPIQKPLQLYSATKVSNEAMAHAYANNKFNSVGLRFLLCLALGVGQTAVINLLIVFLIIKN